MKNLENIYKNSPVVVQNLFCSAKGYLICKRRYNKSFFRYLDKFENREFDPRLRLYDFLTNIADVPFYKKLFQTYNFDVNAVDLHAELRKLPILTKEIAKDNMELISNPFYKGRVTKMRTSGTTGGGLVFPYSVAMENQHWAMWWRYRRWHGINLDTWCGWFAGTVIVPPKIKNTPFWRINLPGKQVMFSAYHLNNSSVKYYHNEINKRGLTWLHGYPSQLSQLASLIIDQQLAPVITVTHVTIAGENFLENQKSMIQKAFPKAIIRQHYGQMEGVASISENPEGRFVVDDDFGYIEFIPVSNDNPNLCHIIGTGFGNEAFPLVRYDTGDIAEVKVNSDGKIEVLAFDGRKEDFITLPNGVKLGRLDYIFRPLMVIKEAQIHQKDLHTINFNIVKRVNYRLSDEKKLLKEIRQRIVDDSIVININYVDKIERTKSGKLRFVISDLK